MSPVIRPESAARARDRILGAIAYTLRVGAGDPTADPAERRDMLAFVALALRQLSHSVEDTAGAWERRGYWVKADKFRQEWGWADKAARELQLALGRQDLAGAGTLATSIASHLGRARTPARLKTTRPWHDAWVQLVDAEGGKA
ncbi:MAG: hypothetical protein M1337_06525 [Actinobacteria bacterium]|nr:hypothetical protein [Actinomycetota bacterium]